VLEPLYEGAAELARLGEALGEHAGEVLERASTRAHSTCPPLATAARSSLARVCVLTTAALARWIAGEPAERSLAPGREAWELLEEIAGRGSATASEVSERCEHWHEATLAVLREQAEVLHSSPSTIAKASSMASTTLAVTLARVSEIFDVEPLAADPDLIAPAQTQRAARAPRTPSVPRRRSMPSRSVARLAPRT
jgi:hypothetical protein